MRATSDFAIYRPPAASAMALVMAPRLERWDAKAAPSQLAIGRYLDHVAELTRDRLAGLGAGGEGTTPAG